MYQRFIKMMLVTVILIVPMLDDNDREDDNMSPHLPLLIELLNLNTLERADLGMYRRLLDITKVEEEEDKEDKEDKDKEE